jgi:hypothetical protein
MIQSEKRKHRDTGAKIDLVVTTGSKRIQPLLRVPDQLSYAHDSALKKFARSGRS